MTDFNLTIDCDNAAFADGELTYEVSRILRSAADKVFDRAVFDFPLKDINGNKVGSVKWSGECNLE